MEEGKSFLEKITLEELVISKRKLIYVHSNTSINEIVNLLQKKNILSVPIWDCEEQDFIGIIDVKDILFYSILGHLANLEETTFKNGTALDIERVVDCEKRRMFVFNSNAKLINAMKAMVTFQRILVRHQTLYYSQWTRIRKNIFTYKLVSQTDVITFLYKNLNKLGDNFSKKTITEIPYIKNFKVISIKERAIDALLKMIESCRYMDAICIVNEKGEMVTNFSASDLRGITEEKLKLLVCPILEFLKLVSQTGPRKPIVCTLENTISEIMSNMLNEKVHQIWIVEKENTLNPIGLVTMGNVIHAALGKFKPISL